MKNFLINMLIFAVVGYLIAIFIPAFYVNFLCEKFPILDYSNHGTIGDVIGGITGPIINLIGAYLVYVAFKAQIDANKQNNLQNLYLQISNKSEKIESWFLDNSKLMKIHKRFSLAVKNKRIFKQKDLKKFYFRLSKITQLLEDIERIKRIYAPNNTENLIEIHFGVPSSFIHPNKTLIRLLYKDLSSIYHLIDLGRNYNNSDVYIKLIDKEWGRLVSYLQESDLP